MFNTNKGMKALPVPKKGQLRKNHFFILAYNVFPLENFFLKKTNAHQYNSTLLMGFRICSGHR